MAPALFISALQMGPRPSECVAIGIGSNLGDPRTNLQFGLRALRRLLDDTYSSSAYETVPVHVADQPSFLNACCIGRTLLTPRQLLTDLHHIEELAGRRRGGARYGPRILDLDLLLYGDRVLNESDLTVPHPRLRERAFVLVPLREIAADWRVPASDAGPERTVRELAEAVDAAGVSRTNLEIRDE